MHSSSMIPVEGHKNLSRDPKTGAIINTNKSEFEKYVEQRRIESEQRKQIETTAKELKEVKEEISEIKDLLVKLANSINT